GPSKAREPGVHEHRLSKLCTVRVHGFRARRCAAPRNDDRRRFASAVAPAAADLCQVSAMRLLFINPYTSPDLTHHRAGGARKAAPAETEIGPATGWFGARYIATRAAAAIAGHAALDVFARAGKGADVVLLACFGDPGRADRGAEAVISDQLSVTRKICS